MSHHHAPPRAHDGVDFAVSLEEAVEPFVMTLDIGSTASRGSLHDATGTPVRGYREKIPHAFTTDADGTSVIDPDQLVEEIASLLETVCDRKELAGRVRGVGLDSFASSLVGVGAEGTALTPCYTYADSRCARELAQLRDELDETRVQQSVGARLHTSYLAPRLRWLARTEPELFGRVTRWMSIGEYIWWRLLGTTAAGTSTAAWTGLLNRRSGRWDRRMLAAAGISADALSPVLDPDQPLSDVPAKATSRWRGLSAAQWFAPVADGLCANLGVGGADESTMVVSAATSGAMRVLLHHRPQHIPSGLWCYRISAHRCLLGGALNDVGRALTWLHETLNLDDAALAEIAQRPTSARTPGVLPFLTGERSTGWAGEARAVFTGVSAATDAPSLGRGMLEGIACSYARVAEQLETAAPKVSRLVAAGRVTQDLPPWLQVLSDQVGTPVVHQTIKRSTCRGNALLMLESLAPDVSRAHPEPAGSYTPDPQTADYYRGVRVHFEATYAALFG